MYSLGKVRGHNSLLVTMTMICDHDIELDRKIYPAFLATVKFEEDWKTTGYIKLSSFNSFSQAISHNGAILLVVVLAAL